jgi:hypothetical protein
VVNETTWTKVSKRIVIGLVVALAVAAGFIAIVIMAMDSG